MAHRARRYCASWPFLCVGAVRKMPVMSDSVSELPGHYVAAGLGATAAVFPSDERVSEWLATQEREEDYAPLSADPEASYDEVEVVKLSELEPLIARPSSPGNVVPVREVAGTKIVQVCGGSSVNSSYEDLAIVGTVLKKNIVHPSIEMTVTPGSRQILDTISRSGVCKDLVMPRAPGCWSPSAGRASASGRPPPEESLRSEPSIATSRAVAERPVMRSTSVRQRRPPQPH